MAILHGGSQSELSSEHEQLLALVNNMTDGFIALDPVGIITLSNSVALSLLDTNILKGKQLVSVMDVIDKNGYPIDIQKFILHATAASSNRDWRLRYKDGSAVNIQLNVAPIHSGYGQTDKGGFVLLIRDITIEKKIEEERDEFISVAGHELRTPVAIAEGSISNALLLAEREKTSDPVKHSLEAAYTQITFLSNLINDLAMLSRADSGRAAQSVETFAPSDLLNSLAKDYQKQASNKKLILQQHLDDGLQVLTTNRLYVHEIMQNFVTNAIKYTSKGTVTLGAAPEENGVVLSVSDTGFGIGQNEQPKLFTKFFRSEDWRVRQISGTGLGLYVSAKLAGVIGAQIDMHSELNKGSTFKLHVPNLVLVA